MFTTLLAGLKAENTNERYSTRRRFTRRDCDNCVVVIDGVTYPVENWSMGGIVISGDSRAFAVNLSVDIVIKFKLSNTVLDVPHTACVVRKSSDRVAFEFEPLTQNVRKGFQSVVEDHVTSKFADSQLLHSAH